MAPLTEQQKLCLDGIADLTIDGVGPTFDELRDYMGLASKSGVHRCVTALIERGHIRRIPARARSLEVVEPGSDPYAPTALQRLDTETLKRLSAACLRIVQARAA